MVDEDKQVSRKLAEEGYHMGLQPEAYITSNILEEYPKAMEPRYLM